MSLSIVKSMDERKKTIRELAEKKREARSASDLILEELGLALLARTALPGEDAGDEFPFSTYTAEHRRILKEIEDTGALIKTIEADTLRLRELEEEASSKEGENSGYIRELSDLYTGLGEILINDPAFASDTGFFRQQIEDLIPRIKSLEGRLEDLSGRSNANVFTWIGKNAQSMVIRSFLGKNQNNLQRIYESAGENFAAAEHEKVSNGDAADLLGKAGALKQKIADLEGDLAALREERRKIADSFSAGGNPAKKIQALKQHIAHTRDELRILAVNFGREAQERQREKDFTDLITGSEEELLAKIRKISSEIKEYEAQIAKLEASLAIDEERAGIEKMIKAIEEQRQRIVAAETAIAGLTKQIEAAEKHIQELVKM